MNRPKLYKIVFILVALGFFSCNRKLFINDNEYILYLNRIKGSKKVSTLDLDPYIKQRPNKRILGMRLSLYAYHFGRQFYDSIKVKQRMQDQQYIIESLADSIRQNDSIYFRKWYRRQQRNLQRYQRTWTEGNWWMRTLGSKPVLFDSTLSRQTQKMLQAYLRSKGFLEAKVLFRTDTILNNIICTYQIDEGKLYTIDSVFFVIPDDFIRIYYKEYAYNSLLKKGIPLDQNILLTERDRAEKYLKDKGFYDFRKDLIGFEIDTTAGYTTVALVISPDDKASIQYKIAGLEMRIDQPDILTDSQTVLYEYTVNGMHFKIGATRYYPVILREKIPLSVGTLYSYTKTQQTLRYLTQLEVFKFASIRYEKDTTQGELKAYIATQSSPRYQLTDEVGMSVTQGLPGPFGSITFSSRNALRLAETFDVSLRAGIEGVAGAADAGNVYRSAELSAITGLTFPRVMGIWGLNKHFINNNPKTRFSASYNYVIRPEYRRYSVRFNMNYLLSKDFQRQYSIGLIDINGIYNPYIDPGWNNYLNQLFIEQGNNLIQSFQNTIVPSTNISYTYNNLRLGQNTRANFLRLYAELGGTTLNFLPATLLRQMEETLNLNAIFIYWKVSSDMRTYLPVGKKNTIALRAYLGLANPYGGDRVLPYERYFFTGGSNSIRAWLPRRLGPGSFSNRFSDGRIDYRYEQPGLAILELNAEYRFTVYRFIESAIFSDAGNVWNLFDNDTRKNLKPTSLDEIALGSGVGLRFNFSFLIVRFDLATKTYDPGRDAEDRWVIRKLSAKRPHSEPGQVLLNIAVGYPF